MKSPRQSSLNNGRPIPSISNQMEHHPTLDALLPIQDGGKCSSIKNHLLLMKRVRLLISQEELIHRTETSSYGTNMERLINSSILSTLMNGRVSQPRENSMKDLDSMSKEISTLSHRWHLTDISTSSATETL